MSAAALAAAALIAGFLLGVAGSRERLRRLRAELVAARRLAEHDALTGLANRSGAQTYHELQTAAGSPPAAVLIDLDGFKAVNDTWGHQAGDAQLIAVAERLTAACAPLGALACRLAGDEFLLLLPDTGPQPVVDHVTAVLARLSSPVMLPTVEAVTVVVTPSASAGIALPEPGSTWPDLLRRADIALYQAKARSGSVVLHRRGMQHSPMRGARRARFAHVSAELGEVGAHLVADVGSVSRGQGLHELPAPPAL